MTECSPVNEHACNFEYLQYVSRISLTLNESVRRRCYNVFNKYIFIYVYHCIVKKDSKVFIHWNHLARDCNSFIGALHPFRDRLAGRRMGRVRRTRRLKTLGARSDSDVTLAACQFSS